MKLQTKLKWIRGVKLFLVIISMLAVIQILSDYDEINDQYIQREALFETLEQLHSSYAGRLQHRL